MKLQGLIFFFFFNSLFFSFPACQSCAVKDAISRTQRRGSPDGFPPRVLWGDLMGSPGHPVQSCAQGLRFPTGPPKLNSDHSPKLALFLSRFKIVCWCFCLFLLQRSPPMGVCCDKKRRFLSGFREILFHPDLKPLCLTSMNANYEEIFFSPSSLSVSFSLFVCLPVSLTVSLCLSVSPSLSICPSLSLSSSLSLSVCLCLMCLRQ